jgi:prepilin-type N-terminal cleavage/methylation domain-containing protein
MNKEKGFTLIELLVVIAIIGILSSIVLASLNSAREKGQNASALASLSSIRSEAEHLYTDAVGYANVCADIEGPGGLLTAAGESNAQTTYCEDDVDEWSAAIGIIGESGYVYCTDHTGFAGKVDGGNAGILGGYADTEVNCGN